MLNPETAVFSVSAFDAGALDVNSVLNEISRVRGRIVYPAVNPRMMGAILAAFDLRLRGGTDAWFSRAADFQWLLSWASSSIFYNAVRCP